MILMIRIVLIEETRHFLVSCKVCISTIRGTDPIHATKVIRTFKAFYSWEQSLLLEQYPPNWSNLQTNLGDGIKESMQKRSIIPELPVYRTKEMNKRCIFFGPFFYFSSKMLTWANQLNLFSIPTKFNSQAVQFSIVKTQSKYNTQTPKLLNKHMNKRVNFPNHTHRSKLISRKKPTNLSQKRTQGLRRTAEQEVTSFAGLDHGCMLILCSDKRQDWSFTPPHTPVTQFNPDSYILHLVKPWSGNRERRYQRHIQRPILRSLHVYCESFQQIIEPKGDGCGQSHSWADPWNGSCPFGALSGTSSRAEEQRVR